MTADTLSTYGSLVRALVERETDHEQIAAACGVPRTLPHDQRTGAILATLRHVAASRVEWASRAASWRAHLVAVLRGAGDVAPLADDATPAEVSERLHAITAEQWRALQALAVVYDLATDRAPMDLLRGLRAAAEECERSRAEWVRDARGGAEALARVADALDVAPVSLDPRDAAKLAARCVATIESLSDRPVRDVKHDAAKYEAMSASRDRWRDRANARLREVERFTASRDVWRRDAAICADGLASVAEALGLPAVSYDPAQGTATAARILDAINLRASMLDGTDTRARAAEARATAAETALRDIAVALGALSDVRAEGAPLDVDALAERCLREIERDQNALAGLAATADELTERATKAERRAEALTRAVACKSLGAAPVTDEGVSRYLTSHGWIFREDLDGGGKRWTYDEPLRTGETHRHTLYTGGSAPIERGDLARLAGIESRPVIAVVAEMIERSDETITPEGGQ